MRQKHRKVLRRPNRKVRNVRKEPEAGPDARGEVVGPAAPAVAAIRSAEAVEPPDPAEEQAVLEADLALVRRCIAGEVAAWEELYARYHDPLMASVQALLGHWTSDADLVDEIAARVWYGLVANDGELLTRYDPKRGGRLTTFMRAIAKDIVSRHVRSERRRLDREWQASYDKPAHHAADGDRVESSVDEFLGTLEPGERQFCTDHLLSSPGDGEAGENGALSRAGFWQKTRRIYRRLLGFLGHGS